MIPERLRELEDALLYSCNSTRAATVVRASLRGTDARVACTPHSHTCAAGRRVCAAPIRGAAAAAAHAFSPLPTAVAGLSAPEPEDPARARAAGRERAPRARRCRASQTAHVTGRASRPTAQDAEREEAEYGSGGGLRVHLRRRACQPAAHRSAAWARV
jgi:hypothetical protein